MSDQDAAVVDNNRSAPITDQITDELEATRLRLQAEQERLDEQRAKLDWQRDDHEHIDAMRVQEHQVDRALSMREKDGVPLFLTPSNNLIAATAAAHAINLSEGTSGHEELRRLKILMEEVILQQAALSDGRTVTSSNIQS